MHLDIDLSTVVRVRMRQCGYGYLGFTVSQNEGHFMRLQAEVNGIDDGARHEYAVAGLELCGHVVGECGHTVEPRHARAGEGGGQPATARVQLGVRQSQRRARVAHVRLVGRIPYCGTRGKALDKYENFVSARRNPCE